MQTKTKPNGDIIMKTFIKTVMAVSMLAASVGASAAPAGADVGVIFDIRDRLEGVYSNFGDSFKGSTAIDRYGELLYIIDNQRIATSVDNRLTLHFDDNNGHILVKNNAIQVAPGLGLTDVNLAVDNFVSTVNTNLFGIGAGVVYTADDLNEDLTDGVHDNGYGIVTNALKTTIGFVTAYNTSFAGSDADTQIALDNFNDNFLGTDAEDGTPATIGFQANFNNTVDVLSTVNTSLVQNDGTETAYDRFITGAESTATYDVNGVTVSTLYGGETYEGETSQDRLGPVQIGEVVSGGQAYADFLSATDEDTGEFLHTGG